MAGIILGVAFLLALAAAKARASESEPTPAGAAAIPASVKKIVASGDPHKMLAAATELHAAGEPHLATHLTNAARDAAAAASNATYPSPFPSVATPEWSQFVHAMRGPDPKEVTSTNHLGMFAFGMPRLVDLGLAENPRKVKRGGRTVWEADWLPPLQPGPQTFLSSPALQYRTFVKATTADLAAIKRELPEAVGTEIDGIKATPSGLLAVAKLAGVAGLKTWLADPAVRAKYPQSGALFHKVNGLF